jgi:FkbM family methyltransferase
VSQVSSPSPVTLKQCRHGQLLFLNGDQYVGRSLQLYGEFSELEANLFEQIVRPGNTVVEIGANIGTHTVHLAQLVGPGGKILAFEPQRVIFQILCANIALNALFNVHTYHAGVGSSAGHLQVPPMNYADGGNFGGLSLTNAAIGETVPIVRLDDMSLPSLSLLKVDVEGMEYQVLDGARKTIAQHRPLMYVENDRKEKSAALIGLLIELGYTMYWHLPKLYNPANFAGNAEDIFPGIVSVNLLCIPKESQITINGFKKVESPDDSWQ